MQKGNKLGGDDVSRRKALVISVSEYSNSLQPLDFCEKDGNEIYNVLKSLGYEIPDNHKLVGQVKYETMKDVIYDFFTDTNTKAEDTLVFYFSGHGVPDVNGDVFLASSELNPDAPFRKGFSFYELTNTIERSNSTRIVTILDCCYSGAAKISKGHEEDAAKLGTSAIDDQSRKLLQQGEGKCLLAASHGYQEAYGLKEKGHSIFTYYLLEGMRGSKKAIDEEGNITPDTLGKYVYREIVNLPEGKRPKQKPIRKVEAGGDIILAQYPELVKKELIQDPYELIQDATEHLNNGDYAAAVQYSDRAITVNSRVAIAYVIKGKALFNLKRYHEALTCFDKALEVRPKYLEALNNRALTFVAIQKYEAAIDSFNQSTDLNPRDAIIWNEKGLAFNSLGRYDEGIECFEKAIKLNPNYTEALKNEHEALSNLREKRQLYDQKQHQKDELDSKITTSASSNTVDTVSDKTKDIGTPSKDIFGLSSSKDALSVESASIKNKKLGEEKPKPKEVVPPSSPLYSSLSNDVRDTATTQYVTGKTTPVNREKNELQSQVTQESNDVQKSVSPVKRTDIFQPTKITYNSVIEREGDRIKPPQQKNLKLIIPILIAGVVGSIIALALISSTSTPPDTTTTSTPPDTTTTSTPPDTTTTSTPPDTTTTSTPPDTTTTSTPPDTTTTSTPPDTTTTSTPPDTTTTSTPPDTTTTSTPPDTTTTSTPPDTTTTSTPPDTTTTSTPPDTTTTSTPPDTTTTSTPPDTTTTSTPPDTTTTSTPPDTTTTSTPPVSGQPDDFISAMEQTKTTPAVSGQPDDFISAMEQTKTTPAVSGQPDDFISAMEQTKTSP